MSFTTYTTQEGERWDTVAYKAYGDASKYYRIMEANPTVPIRAEIPSGTVLNIPIVEQETLAAELLPPWKR